MSSELVAAFDADDLFRETALGNEPGMQVAQCVGMDLRGLPLPKYQRGNLTAYGYLGTFKIPANITMATGLTFLATISDDGLNPSDLGLAVKLGITVKRLAANNTAQLESGTGLAAAELTVTGTLSTTSGGIAIVSLAVVLANLPTSLAVGDVVAFRIRRIGTNAADTATSKVILYRFDIQNT